MNHTLRERRAQSLIEVLIAAAIGVVMIGAASALIVPALRTSTQTTRAQIGGALGKELLENVRVWAEGDWHNISSLATTSANHYYVNATGSPVVVSSGDQAVVVSTTTYTRYFYVDDVVRKFDAIVGAGPKGGIPGCLYPAGGELPVCFEDPSTKKITVEYSWPQSSIYSLSVYLTRHRNSVFVQTDWSGGPGQEGPVTAVNNKFSASSGNVSYSSTTGSILLNL